MSQPWTCPNCGNTMRASGKGPHMPRCLNPYREIETFNAKVKVGSDADCWLWAGAKQRAGYGHFRNQSGKTITASRFAYELAYGCIAAGLHVLHRCDNRACVNPSHLFLGTHNENMADMAIKGRTTRGEKNHSAKLTADQVLEIRSLRGVVRQKDVAAKFGLNITYVSHIWTRQSWKHI